MPKRVTTTIGKVAKKTTVDARSVETQLASFIDKFEPALAALFRLCRREMRKLLPTANELVYDNYNFFVIGYASTDRASDCVASIAAAANGVILSFYYGAALSDPQKLLLGEGKQNRFIRLPSAAKLRDPGVVKLIRAAAKNGKTPLPVKVRGTTIIKSISAKQRPRQKSRAATGT